MTGFLRENDGNLYMRISRLCWNFPTENESKNLTYAFHLCQYSCIACFSSFLFFLFICNCIADYLLCVSMVQHDGKTKNMRMNPVTLCKNFYFSNMYPTILLSFVCWRRHLKKCTSCYNNYSAKVYYEPFHVSRDRLPQKLLHWWSPIWLVFLYVVEASVWWISTQTAWKKTLPFSKYLNFTENTIVKRWDVWWAFMRSMSHEGYIHLAWNVYCERIYFRL
jgi:hypothetical protein